MRTRLVVVIASAVAAGSAAVALANHPKVPPDQVPVGFFTAHSQMSNLPVPAIRKVIKDGRADGFMRHVRLAPGDTTGFVSHPGPVFVMVAAGEITNEEVSGGECVTKRVVPDRGIVTIQRAVLNQRGELVQEGDTELMIERRK